MIKQTKTTRVLMLEPVSNVQDSSSLAEHGDVTVMFARAVGEPNAPGVFATQMFQQHLLRWLAVNKYDPRDDVFAVTGRTTKIAIALATIVSAYGDRGVRVLIYDGGNNQYVERTI